jgi:UDP-glucose 4-epimerase
MRWLVTGGCGFLGINLLGHLAAGGCHGIRIVDDLSVGTEADLARIVQFTRADATRPGPVPEAGVQLAVADIRNAAEIRPCFEAADVVVHFAANAGVAQSVENPLGDCLTNVLGTLNCLEGARAHGIRRFVFASSGASIGQVEPPIHEKLPARPVSPYGASKLAGEGYCSAYFRSYGIGTVALRFGNVYGPGSSHKSSVVAAFISRALAGLPLLVYGDGHQTRDFIFVEDLIRAVARAAHVPAAGGEIFQIATSRETSVSELLDALLPLLQRAGLRPAVTHTGERVGDVRRNFCDTSKAERMLGWRAEVPLSEGLRQTVDWFLRTVERPRAEA